MNERIYWQWLCSVPGLTRQQICVLLKYFGSPREIFEAPDTAFAHFTQLNLSWVSALMDAKNAAFMDKVSDDMIRCGAYFVSREDEAYPAYLLDTADPPYGLFVRGCLPKSDVYTVAVVGARACTAYGMHMAQEIAQMLSAEGIQIVSGMALGIDGIAQKKALESGAPCFAVLGSGVDICYPRDHIDLFTALTQGKMQGGVLSEFPCGERPAAWHFPLRNRVISGLSDAVIVVEARSKSGSLITASLALDQGREVYAVPGRSGDVLSGGCNELIASGGAGIVTNTEALCQALKENAAAKGRRLRSQSSAGTRQTDAGKHKDLSEEERTVLSALDYVPVGIDQLAGSTHLQRSALAMALLELEIKGLARQIGKNQYVRG